MKKSLLVLFLLMSITISLQAQSLIGHWKFDGNAEDAVGAAHGTTHGGIGFVEGKLGQALFFDGIDDYVDMDTVAQIPDIMSISAWVKSNEKFPTTFSIIGRNGLSADNNKGTLATILGNGKIQLLQFVGGKNARASSDSVWASDSLWHHVVFTRDSISTKIYLDNANVAEKFGSPPFDKSRNPLAVGVGKSTVPGEDEDRWALGFIDDIRLYDYALSESEIANLFTVVSTVNSENVPEKFNFALENYPNPFNPSTHIVYTIPKAATVRLIIYNLRGQQVAELVNQRQAAGDYKVLFEIHNLNSGVYVAKLSADSQIATRKIMYLK